jgi:hypothetical protein
VRYRTLLGLIAPVLVACGSAPPAGAQVAPQRPAPDSSADSTGALPPPGFGSLKQDDIALKLQLPGVLVKAFPLDESVIRLFVPDYYKSLSDLIRSKRADIETRARRYGAQQYSLWYVQYYGLEPDARFSPMEFIVTSLGRDLRPVDIVALSSGFGEQRLKQREVQTAIYIMDGVADLSQPLTVAIQGTTDTSWGSTVQVLDRERALIRSRASRLQKPQTPP